MTEGFAGGSWVVFKLACTGGIFVGVELRFLGSLMEAACSGCPWAKEEWAELALEEGNSAGQKWREERERNDGKSRSTPAAAGTKPSSPEMQRARARAGLLDG